MKKTLRDLKRFTIAKNTDDERHEVRAYVTESADELAEVFGVLPEAILKGAEAEEDDATFVCRLLKEIARIEREERESRVEDRSGTAQASADVLGSATVWKEDIAEVDIVSLMAAVLTRRQDMLIFVADSFAVGIPMARLFDLRKLGRVDLSGWVDAKGLHVRWPSGGLNFRPAMDPRAARITVPIPRRAGVVASSSPLSSPAAVNESAAQ